MYWIAAGLLFLGAVCGATIRLVSFLVILAAAAVVAAASSLLAGGANFLLRIVVTLVVLQVGYVAGILLRTAMKALQERRPASAGRAQKRPFRLPSEEKRR